MLNSSSSESSSRSRFLRAGLDHFEHGADVLLDGEAAEDRGFLRQIADAEPRALIHRQLGDVVAVELDRAAIGLDQAGDHVEHGGLAGAVRAEQADRLAAADIDADAAHDLAGAETLFHAMHSQEARPLQQLRRAGAVGLPAALTGVDSPGRAAARPVVGSAAALGASTRHRSRAIGGASRTGLASDVAEAVAERGDVLRERANPGRPRLAGRRRNMLK